MLLDQVGDALGGVGSAEGAGGPSHLGQTPATDGRARGVGEYAVDLSDQPVGVELVVGDHRRPTRPPQR
ncbi:MAG: hypothetical protein ACYC2O_09800, partial [Microthrixaceae bacterium]